MRGSWLNTDEICGIFFVSLSCHTNVSFWGSPLKLSTVRYF